MKLDKKEYRKLKTKTYLKKNKLFFFFNGVNVNSHDWRNVEQDLIRIGFIKNLNKITNKELVGSIFINYKEIANGPTFFIKAADNKHIHKNILLSKFSSLLLSLLAIKINNNIYPLTVLKNNQNSIVYYENALIFYQFSVTHLKYSNRWSFKE